jgi:hypothetical protein
MKGYSKHKIINEKLDAYNALIFKIFNLSARNNARINYSLSQSSQISSIGVIQKLAANPIREADCDTWRSWKTNFHKARQQSKPSSRSRCLTKSELKMNRLCNKALFRSLSSTPAIPQRRARRQITKSSARISGKADSRAKDTRLQVVF